MSHNELPHTDAVNSRARLRFNEEIAEILGSFTIILFGAGSQCQTQLYPHAGGYIVNLLGWAIGVGLGAYISGGISGGHINPAVTIAMATFRKFPWRKVPRYILAQTLGCFLATLIIYANYHDAISASKGLSPVANFISIPNKNLSIFNAWFDEFLGTAVLVGFIFVFTDSNNNPASNLPFALFLLVGGIAAALGAQTGFAINPARDFGPRIGLTLLGYGKDVWQHDSYYWLWGIWLSTIPGGLMGALIADFALYTGTDSVLTRGAISI